jgi:hypothetical protein
MRLPSAMGAVVEGVLATAQTPLSGHRSPVRAVVPMGCLLKINLQVFWTPLEVKAASESLRRPSEATVTGCTAGLEATSTPAEPGPLGVRALLRHDQVGHAATLDDRRAAEVDPRPSDHRAHRTTRAGVARRSRSHSARIATGASRARATGITPL